MNPIKLFAEVTLNSVAVMEARVTAELRALNQSGHLSQPVRVELLDTGSGGEFTKMQVISGGIVTIDAWVIWQTNCPLS